MQISTRAAAAFVFGLYLFGFAAAFGQPIAEHLVSARIFGV